MKKRNIVFIVATTICLITTFIGHVSTTAEASSNKEIVVTPTVIPEKNDLQNEIVEDYNVNVTSDYNVNDSNIYAGKIARPITSSEDGNGIILEPTPMPNLKSNEEILGETIEYFETNNGNYKVVSTIEWIMNGDATSKMETMAAASDYEQKIIRHTRSYWYTPAGSILEYKVASLESSYTVRYYTDNKVHLSARSHTSTLVNSNFSTQIIYGSIVNTDGSVSYTSGDMFKITHEGDDTYFDINFVVTPTTYSFE